MLFHSASRVAQMELGGNAKIDVSTRSFVTEEEEPFYRVHEIVPPTPQSPSPDTSGLAVERRPSIARMVSRSFRWEDNYDARLDTLRINAENLRVHHVQSARFESVSHSVHRSRTERGSTPT